MRTAYTYVSEVVVNHVRSYVATVVPSKQACCVVASHTPLTHKLPLLLQSAPAGQ